MKPKNKNRMLVAGNFFYASALTSMAIQSEMSPLLILIFLGYFLIAYALS